MIKNLLQSARYSYIALFGDPYKRRYHRQRVERLLPIRNGLERLGASPEFSNESSPVFIFAPTWRCGSTLLQRLVMSTGEIWMWGEVYTKMQPLRHLADMFQVLSEEFPDPGLFEGNDQTADQLTNSWIARLSPRPEELAEAHRQFWDRLCSDPAKGKGYGRWGLKSVYLPVDYANYLNWLYPDARIIFIVRNPHRAWLSYRQYRNWYARFPEDPVFTARRFGKLWANNVQGFLDESDGSNRLLIRFEDLIKGGKVLDIISAHIGSTVDRNILEHKVSGTNSRPADLATLTERVVLKRATGELARELEYDFR